MSGSVRTSSIVVRPGEFLLTSEQAESLTGGTWIGERATAHLRGAAFDSRQAGAGCLFACLLGDRVDGHDFVAAAVTAGANLILASRRVTAGVPVLLVADVPVALAALASEYRRRFDPACTWIAIGGANGKTTTKELIAAACVAQAGSARIHATRGNLNNHLGVPITVLNAPGEARFAVIELGANRPGEVAALAAIVKPHIGVVTSIGPEHLEGFGSLEGVARAECELFAALPNGAPCFLGTGGMAAHAVADHTSVDRLLSIVHAAAAGRRLVQVGDLPGDLPVRGRLFADGIELSTDHGTARLPLLGDHNLANATLAFRAAVAAGVSAEGALGGLERVAPIAGRLVPRHMGAHLLLDDTYNANPASMFAGLAVLSRAPGRRLAVLGHMGELGDASVAAHRQVGVEAARLGLPLIAIGAEAAVIAESCRAAGGIHAEEVADVAAAVAVIRSHLAFGPTTVLIKASRSAALERVVQALIAAHSNERPA